MTTIFPQHQLTFKRTITALVVSVFLASTLPLSFTHAQTSTTPKAKAPVHLDEATQDLADEYADILENVSDLVRDYSDYLSDIGDSKLTAELTFDHFTKSLKANMYDDSPDRLAADIDAYLSKLTEINRARCGASDGQSSDKSCRVVRSLRREMNSINEQLTEYQEQLEDHSLTQAEIRKALREAFGANSIVTKQAIEATRKALEQASKELQHIDLTAPQAPHGTTVPHPPTVKSFTKSKGGKWVAVSGTPGVGTQRSSNGVITVSSMSLPVQVTNPNGSIEIVGSTGTSIEASLDFEVSSSSRAREKELADAIGLTLEGERNGYRVAVTVPRLSDPNTQIVSNKLVVSVPARMRLICNGSYGEIEVTGMTALVEARSGYGSTRFTDCSGGMNANSSYGDLAISNCSGEISAVNAYADLSVDGCAGTLSLSNSYSPISVSQSSGKLTIANTGETSVTDHSGPVNITNRYGAVTVSDVKGEVTIESAYQAVEADNIDGRLHIQNSYSPISVSDVTGATLLVNCFSSITGENISGPFDVSSRNGQVELSLGRGISGSSVVSASYGSVRIEVPKTANLLIAAKANNADISSSFPVDKTSRGAITSGVIRLGSARDSIHINSTNAEIEISGRR